MIDLRAKPFYLDDEQAEWVQTTLGGMSQDDKIKQLFIDMAAPVPAEAVKGLVARTALYEQGRRGNFGAA